MDCWKIVIDLSMLNLDKLGQIYDILNQHDSWQCQPCTCNYYGLFYKTKPNEFRLSIIKYVNNTLSSVHLGQCLLMDSMDSSKNFLDILSGYSSTNQYISTFSTTFVSIVCPKLWYFILRNLFKMPKVHFLQERTSQKW